MVYQATRTQDKTEQAVLGIQFLDLVEQTCDDVMATRSLTTRQDDTHVHLLGVSLLCGDKLHDRHTVGVGEELFDLLLITYTLGRLTFLDFHCALKSLG